MQWYMVAMMAGKVEDGIKDKAVIRLVATHKSKESNLVIRILLQQVESFLIDLNFLILPNKGQSHNFPELLSLLKKCGNGLLALFQVFDRIRVALLVPAFCMSRWVQG